MGVCCAKALASKQGYYADKVVYIAEAIAIDVGIMKDETLWVAAHDIVFYDGHVILVNLLITVGIAWFQVFCAVGVGIVFKEDYPVVGKQHWMTVLAQCLSPGGLCSFAIIQPVAQLAAPYLVSAYDGTLPPPCAIAG